ncbi:sensor histidine kinase [Flavobacterium beibuense]|uniref:sensor histidine kinase n=1 Tax=Flavobacterium beibuense TaxID=657326 RepID=UPI003A93E6A7
MNKKLLNITTRSFLRYSVIILIVCAPLFYFMSHWLYVYETDEILSFHKKAFVENELHNGSFSEKDIEIWNKYNRDVEIVPDTGVQKDSIFGTIYFDPFANESEPFRELWAPIEINGKHYTYIEKNNLVEMEDMVYTVAFMFLLIILILMLGIIFLSNRLAKNLWGPFYDTLSQIRCFEIDKDTKPHFQNTGIEEFNQLNTSLDRLIEKNTAIYKNQREFVENAAHELQTPLALFQTKLDNLSQAENLTKDQFEILESLNNDVSRLNRLNKNLLLLSKIDNEAYFEKESVSVNNYINKHLDFFIEQANSKHITVNTQLSHELTLTANPILTEVLINNLFLNAIRHNVKNGSITITTGTNSLTFSNTGNGIALDEEKLFNRFSKTDPSSPGNGLGLAIIKRITEVNNWQIEYLFNNNKHSFIIKF